MRTRRCQPKHHIAGLNFFTIDNFRFFNRTHSKACEIVFTIGVHAGHLGGFTTNQCTSRLLTTGGYAFDDIGCGGDIQTSTRKII